MPTHPALRPKAPPVGVAEVVLEVLVGFLEAVDEVKDGVDDGLVWESDGRALARGAVDCPAISAWTDALKLPDILLRLFRIKI
jgi:hypothetical protein